MPILKPDLTEMTDLSPIPAGTYKATITAADAKQSKGAEGKKPVWMVVPKFDVFVNGSDKPRTRTAYLPVEGAGTYGFDQLLRACHFDEVADQYKDPQSPKPDFDTDQLIGQELQVVIEEEYYQPKDSAGNPTGEPRKQDRIKSFLKN